MKRQTETLCAEPALSAVEDASTGSKPSLNMGYSFYALGVLFLINILILMDRQALTVLAEDIKLDLNLSDADIGFAYGTAISVFYAIFSIPMGKLADVWARKKLLGLCVTAWSTMIFLTGSARGFLSFALCRIGVGVGESGAAPAALSMIADYFPPRLRSTAMSVFAAGVPIGSGLGVYLGGTLLDAWNSAYPDPSLAPLGLKGWQVVFLAIALLGPLLSLWISTLREPVRGQSDGTLRVMPPKTDTKPFATAWVELQSVVPVLSLRLLYRLGGGYRAIGVNLVWAAVIALVTLVMIGITGSVAQWSALAVGIWCVVNWAQVLAFRDRASFEMIIRCRALLLSNLGLAGFVFIAFGLGAWIVPFLMRVHGVSASEAGEVIGLLTVVFGFIGTVSGGLLADYLERYTARARVYVMIGALLLSVPCGLLMLTAETAGQSYVYVAMFFVASTSWYGIGPSVANGLVMPRMRGVSSAFYLIVISLLGAALGPYVIGHISDQMTESGVPTGEALRQAMLWSICIAVPTLVMLSLAALYLPADEAKRLECAQSLGEDI